MVQDCALLHCWVAALCWLLHCALSDALSDALAALLSDVLGHKMHCMQFRSVACTATLSVTYCTQLHLVASLHALLGDALGRHCLVAAMRFIQLLCYTLGSVAALGLVAALGSVAALHVVRCRTFTRSSLQFRAPTHRCAPLLSGPTTPYFYGICTMIFALG